MKIMCDKEKGITLIALVITTVILVILAGISISALTDSNLFEKIKQAKSVSEKAEKNQSHILDEYEQIINGYKAESLTDEKVNITLSEDENTYLKDENGNMFVLPAGFKIKVDEDTNYSKTVDKGIVIIDKDENEFVWIPVGTINMSDGTTKTINLNRYIFDQNGKPTEVNEEKRSGYGSGSWKFQELEISTANRTSAKNIEGFKSSVTQNGGYYVGRYEARTTVLRTSKEEELTVITEKATDCLYNWLTQFQAAQLSQNMYINNKFTSDLMNSYAFDTAICFLQECGTIRDYSVQLSVTGGSIYRYGTKGLETEDIQCNVYDMSANISEFTTECSLNDSNPGRFECTVVGGLATPKSRYATSLVMGCDWYTSVWDRFPSNIIYNLILLNLN